MKRAEELGLSDYKLTEFAKAIRDKTKLLADVQKMLEERELLLRGPESMPVKVIRSNAAERAWI